MKKLGMSELCNWIYHAERKIQRVAEVGFDFQLVKPKYYCKKIQYTEL
jgi:hypothetical protein